MLRDSDRRTEGLKLQAKASAGLHPGGVSAKMLASTLPSLTVHLPPAEEVPTSASSSSRRGGCCCRRRAAVDTNRLEQEQSLIPYTQPTNQPPPWIAGPRELAPSDEQLKRLRPEQKVLLPVRLALDWFSGYLSVPDAPRRGLSAGASEPQRWWLGFGRPPWSEPGTAHCCACTGCLPSPLLCCRCCCCCCCCGARSLQQGDESAYPKRGQLGCFWIQLSSRLHERLLWTVIASFLYCGAYIWLTSAAVLKGCSFKPTDWLHFWPCVAGVLQDSAACCALLCFALSAAVCLGRIGRLDAVMEVMADLRRLQDFKREVERVNFRIRGEAQRQQLLEAVQDRVFGRINVLTAFTGYVLQPDVRGEPEELQKCTKELVDFLEEVDKEMGPAVSWMLKDREDRRQVVKKLKTKAEELRAIELSRAPESYNVVVVDSSPSASVQALPDWASPPISPGGGSTWAPGERRWSLRGPGGGESPRRKRDVILGLLRRGSMRIPEAQERDPDSITTSVTSEAEAAAAMDRLQAITNQPRTRVEPEAASDEAQPNPAECDEEIGADLQPPATAGSQPEGSEQAPGEGSLSLPTRTRKRDVVRGWFRPKTTPDDNVLPR